MATKNLSTDSVEDVSAPSESVTLAPAPTLRADVAQAIDDYWQAGGDAWQQQASFGRREALKTHLATILN